MSFQRKALKLTWPEEHEFHGLEILCRRPTIAQIEEVEKKLESTGPDRANLSALMRETIGAALIRWNYLDEEGSEVPATPDGFAALDIGAQMEILQAWQTKAVAVPKDLGKGSGSGPSSPGRLTEGMPALTDQRLSAALSNLPMLSEPSPSSASSPDTR